MGKNGQIQVNRWEVDRDGGGTIVVRWMRCARYVRFSPIERPVENEEDVVVGRGGAWGGIGDREAAGGRGTWRQTALRLGCGYGQCSSTTSTIHHQASRETLQDRGSWQFAGLGESIDGFGIRWLRRYNSTTTQLLLN